MALSFETFVWIMGSIVVCIILGFIIFTACNQKEDKQEKDEQFNEHKTLLYILLVASSILFILSLYPIFKGQINIQRTTSPKYQLYLLAYLCILNALLTFIYGIGSAIYDMRFCIPTSNENVAKTVTSLRGEHYYPHLDEQPTNCLITDWEIFHFLSYFIIVFIVPRYWWVALLISLVWEGLEFIAKIQNWIDLIMNSSGILLGWLTRRFLY